MIVSSNHPYLSTAQNVIEIAKPLTHLGITYFSYTRTYKNGERVYLTTSSKRLEIYFSENEYLIGNTESHPSNYQPEIVLWSTLPKQELYDKARMIDIDHGIFMIKPNADYNEYYGFATTVKNQAIINSYLTNMDLLKKFTLYFKERAKDLIQQVEKNKLIFPFNKQTIDSTHTLSTVSTFNKVISHNKTKLSKRQIECADLMLNGWTLNEIANQLNLSRRTIETYVDNIKFKLNCRSKTELIIKLSSLLGRNQS